jgi:4-amino-4-deoxy-L-arabinose transferase-like glycosyltransferase
MLDRLSDRLKLRPPWLALIILLCVSLRLGVYLSFPSVFAFEGTGVIQGFSSYDTYGRNLLSTGVYGLQPGVADADFPPLYGYELAAVYGIFGRGSLQVALFHTLLDSLSIVLLTEIGRRLLPRGRPVGLLAGLFYAIYPYLIFQSLSVTDTPTIIFLMYGFVFLTMLLAERLRLDRRAFVFAGLAGLVLGLAALDRPVVVGLAVAVTLWFWVKLGLVRAIKRLVPVAAVCVLVIVPWDIRNYTAFNTFVNIATHAGMNFWFGNSQYTIPFFRAGIHTQWATPEQPEQSLNHIQADSWMFGLGMKYLREHPEQIPELTWVKFLAYWSVDLFPRINPASNFATTTIPVPVTVNPQGQVEVAGVAQDDPVAAYSQPLFDRIGRTVHIFYFGSLLLLALIGIVLTVRYWKAVSLLWFIQISMTVVYVVFSGPTTRYRVPTDPLLFLFSAYTLVMLWNYGRRRVSGAADTTGASPNEG